MIDGTTSGHLLSQRPSVLRREIAPVERSIPIATMTRRTPEDEARIRTMVLSNFEFIWRTLRGHGIPARAVDDATQRVFLIASRKLDSIVAGSERAFLYSTARGVAANVRRTLSRSREDTDEGLLARAVDGKPDPEQEAQRSESKRLLEQILGAMEEDARDVFVLFELEGFTSAEIAALLGIPVGTVASRLRRARTTFFSWP